jgi:hypothetical protein
VCDLCDRTLRNPMWPQVVLEPPECPIDPQNSLDAMPPVIHIAPSPSFHPSTGGHAMKTTDLALLSACAL